MLSPPAARAASTWAGRLLAGAKDYVAKVRDPHPPTQRLLYSFDDDLTPWTVTTDAAHGGASEARLTRRDGGTGAEFAGTLAPGAGLRGAFASMTAQQPTPLDLSPYDALTFRVASDGRPYIVSLRTANWVAGDGAADAWHAFLMAPRSAAPSDFVDVALPLSRFLLTHRGRLVESRVEMNAARVVSLGVGAAARAEGGAAAAHGPFRVAFAWIRAEASERGLR